MSRPSTEPDKKIIDSGAATVNRTDPDKVGTLDAWSLARKMAPTLRETALFLNQWNGWYSRSSPDEKFNYDPRGLAVFRKIQDHPYRGYAFLNVSTRAILGELEGYLSVPLDEVDKETIGERGARTVHGCAP